jgi:Domain of unknown function (DUF4276)
MRWLGTALYAEGSSDASFLQPLLQRACTQMCLTEGAEPVEVSDVINLQDSRSSRGQPREQRIAAAARQARGAWSILFIHADADGNDEQRALTERVEPARTLLHAEWGAQSVAVVPLRMTEAWVLADSQAVRSAFGTTMSAQKLGLAEADAHGADRLTNPKVTLEAALRASRGKRRATSVGPYLGLIGQTCSFNHLQRLAAYRRMEEELRAALRTLRFVAA